MNGSALIMLLSLPRRLWRDQQGASLLEMTVVMPFLLAFGLGVAEFGNALYQYHLVNGGVRDAGRYLGSVDKDAAGATSNARKIAVCGDVTSCTTESDKRVNWWPPAIADIDNAIAVKYCIDGVAEGDTIADCICVNPALNPDPGFGSSKVCVSTTATYGDLGFLAYFGIGPLTFTTGHEQRYYGIR